MSFFEELRRRNVFRVGIAYGVAAWLLIQISDTVFPRIGLSDSAVTLVIALLAIGFVPALIFAWAFEMTPEGLKREREVNRTESITPQTGRKLDRVIIAVMAVALAWFAWDKFAREPSGMAPGSDARSVATQEAGTKSVAVLPFVNMSSDPEQEYFSDGISEEILNALAKVDALKVAGRTSSFAFKGQNQDLRRIGDALDVTHILEGSVRKAGKQVRITAQLIQVEDGFHLWSETYDRELTDVFAIQDEIAASILSALKTELLEGAGEVIAATETDPEAYQLYLRAKQHIYERNRQSIEAAVAMLDSALAIDPDYAPALAQRGIATLLLQSRNYGTLTREQAEPLAKRYLDRAIDSDPETAEAWAGLGLYHNNRARETQLAVDALEKALALNPNLIDARNWLQQGYGNQGEARKGLRIAEDMFERDPLYPPALVNLVLSYARLGMFDQAERAIERVAPYLPGKTDIPDAWSVIHTMQGNYAQTVKLSRKSLAQDPDNGSTWFTLGIGLLSTLQFEAVLAGDTPPFQRILALHALGRTEEATLAAYEQAATGGVGSLIHLLNREGRPADVVRFFDDRWTSVAQFDREYPGDNNGNQLLLGLAYAFSRTGDQARFEEAMALVREDHDALIEQGVVFHVFLWAEAYYHALAGDEEEALEFLERAVDSGGIMAKSIAWALPVFKSMEGDPRFDAIQQRMIEHVNQERAELGLEPVEG